MRIHTRVLALMGIVASGGVFACVGGGGPFDDTMSTRDPAASSFERAENTREPDPGTREGTTSSHEGVGTSAEPGPGAQGTGGAGGFQCAGTFTCVEDGDDDGDELTFTSTGAGCSVSVGENTLVLSADGTAVNLRDTDDDAFRAAEELGINISSRFESSSIDEI